MTKSPLARANCYYLTFAAETAPAPMKVKALENTLECTPSPVSAPLKGLGSGSLPGTCGFVSGSHVIKSTPAFLFPRYGILSFPPLFFFKSLSRVQLFATPWTIQSMEFSRPEYWSG